MTHPSLAAVKCFVETIADAAKKHNDGHARAVEILV
jgi:hypothetical protein